MDRPITAGLERAGGFLIDQTAFSLAGSSRSAPAGTGLWSSLGRLLLPPAPQLAGGLLGLLEILVAGAPEDDAARDAADGDRHAELCVHAHADALDTTID